MPAILRAGISGKQCRDTAGSVDKKLRIIVIFGLESRGIDDREEDSTASTFSTMSDFTSLSDAPTGANTGNPAF